MDKRRTPTAAAGATGASPVGRTGMLLLLLLRRRLLLLLRLLVEQNVPVVCTRGSGAQLWDQTHSKKSAPGHTAGRTPAPPHPPPHPPT